MREIFVRGGKIYCILDTAFVSSVTYPFQYIFWSSREAIISPLGTNKFYVRAKTGLSEDIDAN
jgi:hypothetical protein